MEQSSDGLNGFIALLRRQNEDFEQEQEQHEANVVDEDLRQPNESLSEEVLQLLIERTNEEINVVNGIQNDILGIDEGLRYINEIIADVRNIVEEAEQENDADDNVVNGDDNEVIVIEDDSDDDNAVIEIDADEDEQDIQWDEFSMSEHSTDSGYIGSNSDISDATFYSAYSDELVHNEVCHFGFLVYPQHVREPVREPVRFLPEALPGASSQSPRGMSNSNIQNWLQNTEFAMKTGQKRKRDDSDVEVDDNAQSEPRRKKFRKIIRQSKSETCVQKENIAVKQSFSDAFLL